MGFSPVGLVIAVVVTAPSLVLAVLPPSRPLPRTRTPLALVVLEHVAQPACLVLLVLSGTALGAGARDWGLAPTALCLVAYVGLWVRYVVRGRDARLLYDRAGPVPLPMAVLPVLVFALSALWAGSVWLGIATGALAIGHLAVSRDVRRALAGSAPR